MYLLEKRPFFVKPWESFLKCNTLFLRIMFIPSDFCNLVHFFSLYCRAKVFLNVQLFIKWIYAIIKVISKLKKPQLGRPSPLATPHFMEWSMTAKSFGIFILKDLIFIYISIQLNQTKTILVVTRIHLLVAPMQKRRLMIITRGCSREISPRLLKRVWVAASWIMASITKVLTTSMTSWRRNNNNSQSPNCVDLGTPINVRVMWSLC